MKGLNILFLLFFSFCSNLSAQDKDPNTPKEFLKGKLNEGQVWDYPFTMFNRNRDNSFNWQEDII
jgi:hypothetical protein